MHADEVAPGFRTGRISWYRSDERTISMANTRKRYSADFKAKVALEALKGELTLAQLAAKHGVHQTMISTWRKQGNGRDGVGVFRQGRSCGGEP